MKKNEPKQPENQPANHKDKLDQPSQEKLSQDVLSDEELEEVNGGLSDFHFTKKIDKASPNLFIR